MKGGGVPNKNEFKTQNTELRWLASEINFKPLHAGCGISHRGGSSPRLKGGNLERGRQKENEK